MKKRALILIIIFICVGCGCSTETAEDNKIDNVAKVEDDKIDLATYKSLNFKSTYEKEQVSVRVKNISKEQVVINKIKIKVHDKSGRVNNYEFDFNETLEKNETANFTFAYKIKDIKKIEYLYE